jgi:hypothetical protein
LIPCSTQQFVIAPFRPSFPRKREAKLSECSQLPSSVFKPKTTLDARLRGHDPEGSTKYLPDLGIREILADPPDPLFLGTHIAHC